MAERHELRWESHEMRWGGLAGIGAVVLAVIGRLVMGRMPRITDSADVIASYMSSHRGQIMTGAVLYAIALALFLWFGAALATAFRRADEASDLPAVVLAGFVLVSAIGYLAVSVFAGLTYAVTSQGAPLPFAGAAYTAVTVVGTLAGIAVALTLGAVAVAIAHTRVLPMWMAWFAGIVAAIRLLAALPVGATGGALLPGSWLTAYIPGLLTGLWVLGASGLLVREQLPLMEMRAPRVAGPGPA